MMNAKALGAKIKELRDRRGLTQDELALLAGLSKSYISLLENGERGEKANLEMIHKVARALKVSSEELLMAGGYIKVSKLDDTAYVAETYRSLPAGKRKMVDAFLTWVAQQPANFRPADEGQLVFVTLPAAS